LAPMYPIMLSLAGTFLTERPMVSKWAALDPAPCKGAEYTHSPKYGSIATQYSSDLVARGGWRGAVLGPQGDKVYGIPTNASAVIEVDTRTRQIYVFGEGKLGRSTTAAECKGEMHCGIDKWIGGVLAPNGKIIGIPYAAESVLEIDPATHTVSTFGVISSPLHRKWLGGVLGANGLIYAIPYDAEAVLEINPETKALSLFGQLGTAPCKWYGGEKAPNGKIYAIPYSERYVLEIDVDKRSAVPFAMVKSGWGKWAGAVLAPNGRIYGIPALSTSILEVDPEQATVSTFGMLSNKGSFSDKWNGGVLAPNGRIYGIPWVSQTVLEFDPNTKSISLLGDLEPSNFTWHGGVVAKNGRIVALPYNSRDVLEIGESVCTMPMKDLTRQTPYAPDGLATKPTISTGYSIDGIVGEDGARSLPVGNSNTGNTMDTVDFSHLPPVEDRQTYIVAMIGCPDASKTNEDACFHMGHRTWHSAMITIAERGTTLDKIREKVHNSGLLHMPLGFCFLFKGHPLDPSIESTLKAATISTPHEQHLIVFVDHEVCSFNEEAKRLGDPFNLAFTLAAVFAAFALLLGLSSAASRCCAKPEEFKKSSAASQTNTELVLARLSKPCPPWCLRVPRRNKPPTSPSNISVSLGGLADSGVAAKAVVSKKRAPTSCSTSSEADEERAQLLP